MSQGHGPNILVGYDGSEGSERALRWAVREAQRRSRLLFVCVAWAWPYPEPPLDASMVDTVRRMSGHVLDKGVMVARGLAPELDVHKFLVKGSATSAILSSAVETELIVIGSHGTGGSAGAPVGSAALQVPAHALCPVIVHRSRRPEPERVVIGVDGSPASDAALAFGFEEAALRDWEVRAVYGVLETEPTGDASSAAYGDVENLKRAAGATLERAVSPWRDKYARVTTSTSLVLDSPRQALLAAAEQAGLLVVGDRSAQVLADQRLGSVALAALQNARCPVAITPPWRHDD